MEKYTGEAIYVEATATGMDVYVAKANAMYIMQQKFFEAIKRIMVKLGFKLMWEDDKSINMSGNTTLQDVYMLEGIEKYVRFIYSQNIDSNSLRIYVSVDNEVKLYDKDASIGNSTEYVGGYAVGYDTRTKALGGDEYEAVVKMRSQLYINILIAKHIQLFSISNNSKSKEFSDNWFGTATVNGERNLITKRADNIEAYGNCGGKINYNLLTELNMEGDGKIVVMPVFISNGCVASSVIMENLRLDGCLQNAGKKVEKGSFVSIDGVEYIAIGTDGRWLVEL